jgi:hypothetical protein
VVKGPATGRPLPPKNKKENTMGELVPRDQYDPGPTNRQARRQLARIDEQAQVRQAAIVARTREELARVIAEEKVTEQRINGVNNLAELVVSRATHLNQRVNQASRDNPGLELTLREVEYKAALVCGLLVYDYGNRR